MPRTSSPGPLRSTVIANRRGIRGLRSRSSRLVPSPSRAATRTIPRTDQVLASSSPSPFSSQLGAAHARAQNGISRLPADRRRITRQMSTDVCEGHLSKGRQRRGAASVPTPDERAPGVPARVQPVWNSRILQGDDGTKPSVRIHPCLKAVETCLPIIDLQGIKQGVRELDIPVRTRGRKFGFQDQRFTLLEFENAAPVSLHLDAGPILETTQFETVLKIASTHFILKIKPNSREPLSERHQIARISINSSRAHTRLRSYVSESLYRQSRVTLVPPVIGAQ